MCCGSIFSYYANIIIGVWGVGLANRSVKLNVVPPEENCWILRHTGELVANGEVIGKIGESLEEGDCIVSFSTIISIL